MGRTALWRSLYGWFCSLPAFSQGVIFLAFFLALGLPLLSLLQEEAALGGSGKNPQQPSRHAVAYHGGEGAALGALDSGRVNPLTVRTDNAARLACQLIAPSGSTGTAPDTQEDWYQGCIDTMVGRSPNPPK